MDSDAHGCADASLPLFERLLSKDWLAERRQELNWRGGGGLFSAALTIWVSIRQQIVGGSSLQRAWALCSEQEALRLSPKSARAKRGNLATHPSGLDHARHAIPLRLVEDATDHLFWEAWASFGRTGLPTFLLDGSSVTPASSPELDKAYPAAPTQFGKSHWPVVRLVTAHDLATGLAVRPEYGPFFGPDAVGEQTLAKRLLDRLPLQCLVIADRGFGIFQMAWALRERKMLIRMKEAMACSLLGKTYKKGEDFDGAHVWKPSAVDRKTHGFDSETCVAGRVVVRTVHAPHQSEPVRIYLFTNDMETSAEDLVHNYTARWNIETDLRSLKQSVGLESPKSESVDMLSKEMLLAFAAYNLIRVMMVQAANKAGVEPRRISFTRARDYMEAYATRGPVTPQSFEQMLVYIAARLIPIRPERHYPRQQWTKYRRYPARKVEANA
jgi:putative transposase